MKRVSKHSHSTNIIQSIATTVKHSVISNTFLSPPPGRWLI